MIQDSTKFPQEHKKVIKFFTRTTWSPFLKAWGLGIILISLLSTLLIFWLLRKEPMPTPCAPDNLPAPEQVRLTRTDTLDQKRLVCLLNATPKELMTVFLQTWNVVPPQAIVESPDRIWSFAEVPAFDLLDWTATIYDYALSGERAAPHLEKASEAPAMVNEPEQCPDIVVKAGKLGDRLWHSMRDAELEFFAVLPEAVSNSMVEEQKLDRLLEKNNISLAKRGPILILWREDN